MDWEKKFKIIEEKISKAIGKKASKELAAEFLGGVSPSTYRRWTIGEGIPDANDLVNISNKLNLSPHWLLLGIGQPEMTHHKKISTCNIYIADTLRDLIADIDRPKDEIAITGGMYPGQLYSILERVAELPSEAIQKWIHAYKINANFLLAQIGKPFLTEEEYLACGPLGGVRQDRGDNFFTEREDEEMQNTPDKPADARKKAPGLKDRAEILEALLAAKDETITAKNEALAAKNETITAKNEALAAKNEVLAARDEALAACRERGTEREGGAGEIARTS